MLSSRADPRVPLVFAISSKMSSTPTQICLFRNYNYGSGEMTDAFVQDPIDAKEELGLDVEDDVYELTGILSYDDDEGFVRDATGGSRHPGKFSSVLLFELSILFLTLECFLVRVFPRFTESCITCNNCSTNSFQTSAYGWGVVL